MYVYNKRPTITRSKAIYNTNMIFPCCEAMLSMTETINHVPYFVPGEDELDAMTLQWKKIPYTKLTGLYALQSLKILRSSF
ncbi:hypothetical protein MFLAVUS_007072 [Mucor flavus]|uniref:Uncharacterized protein n=1 Tax=Mucor flavus TaxID=439312 RepID=A0ABP9Z398_9FUNG